MKVSIMYEQVNFTVTSAVGNTLTIGSRRGNAENDPPIKIEVSASVNNPVRFHLISKSNGSVVTALWTGGSLQHVAPVLGMAVDEDGMCFRANRVMQLRQHCVDKQEIYIVQ